MKRSTFSTFIIAAALLTGCGSDLKPYDPNGDGPRKTFFYPVRQNAPEPVYNRVRYSYLPEVMPERNLEFSNAPKILPVVHLELKNVTLEETALTLAATARYRSYCSGLIANRRFSINQLGTIDELAESIATKAKIKVVVDHANHEIRFHGETPDAPVLPKSEPNVREAKEG